jgi:hypothetical protein
MFIYTNIYIYTYIYIYINIFVYIYLSIYQYMYIYIHLSIHINSFIGWIYTLINIKIYREQEKSNIHREQEKSKAAKIRAKLCKGLTKNIKTFNMIMASRMEVHKLVQMGLFLELRSMVIAIWPSAVVS